MFSLMQIVHVFFWYAPLHGHRCDLGVRSMWQGHDIALQYAGSCLKTSRKAQQIATQFDHLYFTAGVHPHNAKQCNSETIGELRQLLSDPKCVAVGECGLDFNRDFSPRDVQEQWFHEQVPFGPYLIYWYYSIHSFCKCLIQLFYTVNFLITAVTLFWLKSIQHWLICSCIAQQCCAEILHFVQKFCILCRNFASACKIEINYSFKRTWPTMSIGLWAMSHAITMPEQFGVRDSQVIQNRSKSEHSIPINASNIP